MPCQMIRSADNVYLHSVGWASNKSVYVKAARQVQIQGQC